MELKANLPSDPTLQYSSAPILQFSFEWLLWRRNYLSQILPGNPEQQESLNLQIYRDRRITNLHLEHILRKITYRGLALLIALAINGYGDTCGVIFAKDYTITQNDVLLSRPLLIGTMRKKTCELEELFNHLKKRACDENANLAHILKIKEPNLPWGNPCYEIHAILYQCRGKMEYTEFSLQNYISTPEEKKVREDKREIYLLIMVGIGLISVFFGNLLSRNM